MPTLQNWNALNIQTTAKQVCCTLSAWNYANSKRAWYYNGNRQIVSNTQKIPAQMRAREKILSKFSYPRKSQTGKFQTLRSLDLPRHLKSGWAQRPPRPHFTAKGLDTAHLCINMQPQDCSQHDWVSLLRWGSGYRFNQWRNKIEPSPLPWIFKMVPSAISLIRLLDSGRRPYSKRRLDILRLLSMSYGRIGRRKQVKRAKKCLWDIWSMKRKCSHEAKFALQISWRTDSESGYIWMDVEIFESTKENFRIQKYPDTCGRALGQFYLLLFVRLLTFQGLLNFFSPILTPHTLLLGSILHRPLI